MTYLSGGGGTGDSSWTAVASLLNSWVQVAGWSVAGFRKDGQGFVHIRGRIEGGAQGTVAFTLPSGYRPSGGNLLFPNFTTSGGDINGVGGGVVIQSTGDVTVNYGAVGASRIALDGITFSTT